MVTLVSQISNYFEQFNSSLTDDVKSTARNLFRREKSIFVLCPLISNDTVIEWELYTISKHL